MINTTDWLTLYLENQTFWEIIQQIICILVGALIFFKILKPSFFPKAPLDAKAESVRAQEDELYSLVAQNQYNDQLVDYFKELHSGKDK